ncbi:hypothetical protein Dimus_034928 [Dionaea muscipula]
MVGDGSRLVVSSGVVVSGRAADGSAGFGGVLLLGEPSLAGVGDQLVDGAQTSRGGLGPIVARQAVHVRHLEPVSFVAKAERAGSQPGRAASDKRDAGMGRSYASVISDMRSDVQLLYSPPLREDGSVKVV